MRDAPQPEPEPEKQPEIPKGFKEDIFGNIVPIERKQISKSRNLLKGETYEGLIERFKELIKQENEEITEENVVTVTGRLQDYLQRIQRAKTQIRTRDARKANLEKMKKQLQSMKKGQDKKIQQATEQLSAILEQQEQKAEAREEKATEQRKEIKTAIQNINDVVRGDARATEIKDTVFTALRTYFEPEFDIKRDTKTYQIKKPKKESKLSKENINQLIKEIPEKYRSVLAPTVRSLFSGNSLNANTIVSGIVGMGLAITTGSSIAGNIGLGAFNFLRESLGINFNELFQPAQLTPQTEQLPPVKKTPPPIPQKSTERKKLPPPIPIRLRKKPISEADKKVSEFLRKNTVSQYLKDIAYKLEEEVDLDDFMENPPDTPRQEYGPEASKIARLKGESDMAYITRLETLLRLAQQNNDNAKASRIKNIIANLDDFMNPFRQIETKHSAQIGLDLADVDEKGAEQLNYGQVPVIEDIEMKGEDIKQNTGIMSNIVSMLTGYFSRVYDRAMDQSLLRNTIDYLSRLPVAVLPLLFRITQGKNSRDRDLALATAGVVLTASMDRKQPDYGALDDIPLDEPLPDDYFDEPEQKGRRGIQIPRLIRPTLEDVNQGITAGTVSSALGGFLSRGSVGALQGITTGGMAGAIGGGVSASALRTYFNQRGEQVSDSKIQMLAALPTAMLGAYLGYQGTGKELVSGAKGGVTETKINVDADVLKSTKAQVNQEIGKNKQWAPKTIAPTPSILDKPPQEMYAEDLEATLFNYIAPTSEGADGTVFTNQLKRNQYMNEQLRYYKSGVFVPAKLWEQMNTPENMTKEKLDRLALGQKPIIPEMQFLPQDNETTFENVARVQYPNNELNSIEFLDPYSSYSNTDNFWATNPQSVLYTINP